jgi:hypothetical protein
MGPLVLRRPATLIVASAFVATLNVVGATAVGAGQQPPPIDGVTGTVATEETKKDVHEAGRGVFGKVARFLRLNRKDTVAAGPEGGEDTLAGMKAGTAVVIHATTASETVAPEDIERLDAEGVKPIEGVVTAVNRRERTISIKLADNQRRTFRLSDRAADEVDTDVDRAGDGAGKVILYVKDEAGDRVVQHIKRVPAAP